MDRGIYRLSKFVLLTAILVMICAAPVFFFNIQNYMQLWESKKSILATLGFVMSDIYYSDFRLLAVGLLAGIVVYVIFGKKIVRFTYKFKSKALHQETDLYRKVEMKKQMAKEMKIPEMFEKLYHTQIRYYPAWIKDNRFREHVCSLVTDAEDLGDGRIKIRLKENDYVFAFKKENIFNQEGKLYLRAKMELFLNDKKILGLHMVNTGQMLATKWRSSDIEAFIEGDWINDFKQLHQQIEVEATKRVKEDKKEKLDKIRKDFGLD